MNQLNQPISIEQIADSLRRLRAAPGRLAWRAACRSLTNAAITHDERQCDAIVAGRLLVELEQAHELRKRCSAWPHVLTRAKPRH